jgi:hypothetical protein
MMSQRQNQFLPKLRIQKFKEFKKFHKKELISPDITKRAKPMLDSTNTKPRNLFEIVE